MRAALESSTELYSAHERATTPRFSPPAGGLISVPIPLSVGAVYSHQIAPGETFEISVPEGSCWITLEGDPEDYVVESGSKMLLTGAGLVVAEGLLASNAVSFIPVVE